MNISGCSHAKIKLTKKKEQKEERKKKILTLANFIQFPSISHQAELVESGADDTTFHPPEIISMITIAFIPVTKREVC